MLDGVLHQLGDHHDQRGGPVGVEHPQSTLPVDPDRGVQPGDIIHHRQDPVDDLVEVDLLVDRHRQRLMHVGDRGHPPHRLQQGVIALLVGGAPGLKPQQRRDGLQIVLHPVVDLADGGVLGQQRAVAALDLGDVADQHRRPGRRAADHQGQGAQQHGGPAGVDLQSHARAAGHRGADVLGEFVGLEGIGDQRAGDRHQVVALQLRGQAHPVVGRQRVGAGVADHAIDIQADETVTDPGAGPGDGLIADIGESPFGDHIQKLCGAIQVGLLQPRGGAPAVTGGLVGEPRHHLLAVTHRHRPRHGLLGHDGADRVGDQQGGSGVGPALCDAHQLAVLTGHPHQEVPEGQVGQQLPLSDYRVQMVDRPAGQQGVLGEQITEGRHGRSRVSR